MFVLGPLHVSLRVGGVLDKLRVGFKLDFGGRERGVEEEVGNPALEVWISCGWCWTLGGVSS